MKIRESFALEFQLKNEEIIDYIDTQLTGSQCDHLALYIFHLAALSRKILREDRVFYFLPLNPSFIPQETILCITR